MTTGDLLHPLTLEHKPTVGVPVWGMFSRRVVPFLLISTLITQKQNRTKHKQKLHVPATQPAPTGEGSAAFLLAVLPLSSQLLLG